MIRLLDLLESNTPDPKAVKVVKKLLQIKDYTAFVKKLKSIISDPAVLDILDNGKEDGSVGDEKIKISSSSLLVKNGIPTQNEVDIDKSLSYQLEGKGQVQSLMSGGTITIAGPIITLNNKYVLDGHHRWSQAYCFNPNLKLSSLNITGIKDWKTALKAIQMAIGTEIKQIPVNVVNGKNLFTMGEAEIVKYVERNALPKPIGDMVNSDNLIKWCSSKGIELTEEIDTPQNRNAVGKFIANNIKVLQAKSKPPSGVSNRGYMPQTDNAPGFAAALKSGEVNFLNPITIDEGKYPGGGDCYVANAKYFQDKFRTNKKARLVHGEVQMQNQYPVITYGHCFIVDGNVVIDVSNGRNIKMNKRLYYLLGRIDEHDNVIEYTQEDVLKNILKYKHWGPWHLKTKR